VAFIKKGNTRFPQTVSDPVGRYPRNAQFLQNLQGFLDTFDFLAHDLFLSFGN
jgi:hypothetical protein